MAAPLGNQNAIKGRRWQQAIDRALDRRSKADAIHELDRLAEKFLDQVEDEGIRGFSELGDRLDGKPKQQIEATGADGGPLVVMISPEQAKLG